jgi:murein DD-endopeptidase MepM/ murein hydrolase activator NlpD
MHVRAVLLPLIGLLLASCMSPQDGFVPPLDDTSVRETPLYFGLYVTPDPAHNPIDPPERFIGYHTALDFEILPGEEEEEVPVYAICDGRILSSRTADGYGGVLVQHCRLEGKPITVLYGHLATDSMVAMRTRVKRGQTIAVLAPANSADSGETRKHLHLAIHRGSDIELQGYVQTPEELKTYIDPATVLGLPRRSRATW